VKHENDSLTLESNEKAKEHWPTTQIVHLNLLGIWHVLRAAGNNRKPGPCLAPELLNEGTGVSVRIWIAGLPSSLTLCPRNNVPGTCREKFSYVERRPISKKRPVRSTSPLDDVSGVDVLHVTCD
jgi:hypothetical protein